MMPMMRLLTLSLSLALALTIGFTSNTATTAAPPETSSLGDKLADWCQAHRGEQVGEGECAHLAGEALKAVGGKRRGPDKPEKGDYTWGTQVYLVEGAADKPRTDGKRTDVARGDIIQLRNAKFAGRREGGGTYSQTMPHHTAVVTSIDGDVVHILHQNFGGKRVVIDGKLKLNDLKEGWLRFYRPIPTDSKK
jgi:hypothetical protein